MGQVTTFYSYKGGVGRTFLLANVAWLLARAGKRVLCVDWDLEAPGLLRYLKPAREPERGVIDLLAVRGDPGRWRDMVVPVEEGWGPGCLHLLAAGRQDPTYIDRVQAIDWDALLDGGELQVELEAIRETWVEAYDHVLLDSRTGITDIGGICAVQMPDVLVMVLTSSWQSLHGTLDVARRVDDRRRRLPIARAGVRVLPVAARLHSGEEAALEAEWFSHFERHLAPLFDPWKDADVETRQYLFATRVREFARWSYGEELPVRSEGIDDPLLVSWSFANVAALLERRLAHTGGVTRDRDAWVRESLPGLPVDGHGRDVIAVDDEALASRLSEAGVARWAVGTRSPSAWVIRNSIDDEQLGILISAAQHLEISLLDVRDAPTVEDAADRVLRALRRR